jgi:ectoine hydroxylase-related dioxygenase (phytanoyl-CoA dioxygenase family)
MNAAPRPERPAPPASDFEVTPTADPVAFFREHGFLRVERVTTDEELAWLAEIYDTLFREERGTFRGGYFDLARPYDVAGQTVLPQVLYPARKYPELLETTYYRNGRRFAAALLGVENAALESWGHMILKRARVGPETPWHQDESYWDPSKTYRALGMWMPLDDATVESGCLHFIPGSHRRKVEPHRHIGDDPAVHGLHVAPGVDTSGGVPQPIPAGGATFHHQRTMHYAGPNAIGDDRRACATEFQLPPADAAEVADRPWLTDGLDAWNRRAVYTKPKQS